MKKLKIFENNNSESKNIKDFNNDTLKSFLQKLHETDDKIEFNNATMKDVDYILGLGWAVSHPQEKDIVGEVFDITVSND